MIINRIPVITWNCLLVFFLLNCSNSAPSNNPENPLPSATKTAITRGKPESFAAAPAIDDIKQPRKDYGVFFVVTDFDYWPDFEESVYIQVEDIAKELETNYGFEIEIVRDPTRADILDVIKKYISMDYNVYDQLLLYFSMHGQYEEGRKGALVPKDGKLEDIAYETTIMHPLLEDIVNQIPCKHITLALDACYSGTFKQRGKPKKPIWDGQDNDCMSKVQNALQYKTRRYLTSGGDIQTPADSKFANKWLEGLRSRNDDGLMSYYDLYSVLSEANPVPESGEFSGHKGGDFIFVHKSACDMFGKTKKDSTDWANINRNVMPDLLEHLRMYPNCPHYEEIIELLETFEGDNAPSPTDNGTNYKVSKAEVYALMKHYKLFTEWKINPKMKMLDGDVNYFYERNYSSDQLRRKFKSRMILLQQAEKTGRVFKSKGELSFFAEQIEHSIDIP